MRVTVREKDAPDRIVLGIRERCFDGLHGDLYAVGAPCNVLAGEFSLGPAERVHCNTDRRAFVSNGPTEAINGRLEHLRGSALGFRNLTHYIARSLLEAGGFRPHLHP